MVFVSSIHSVDWCMTGCVGGRGSKLNTWRVASVWFSRRKVISKNPWFATKYAGLGVQKCNFFLPRSIWLVGSSALIGTGRGGCLWSSGPGSWSGHVEWPCRCDWGQLPGAGEVELRLERIWGTGLWSVKLPRPGGGAFPQWSARECRFFFFFFFFFLRNRIPVCLRTWSGTWVSSKVF